MILRASLCIKGEAHVLPFRVYTPHMTLNSKSILDEREKLVLLIKDLNGAAVLACINNNFSACTSLSVISKDAVCLPFLG